MKHTYTSLCTAALLMLAACTNDPAEDLLSSNDTRPDALPEGTFVVDYLPSADLPATRGLGEGEAILSLDYLLYASKDDQEYTLQKHTSISDINAKTRWPLTRDNMTWQQRQELKDTLTTGSKYKVVFVANADKEKVWNDKTDFQPMTGVDNDADFDDARLFLPPNGDFQQQEDGKYTFYYMWTGEIDPTTNGYDKNTPAQMLVKLQRMVNKVEIRLADEVVQGIESVESVDAYVTNFLTNYYDTYYLNENKKDEELYDIAQEYLTGKAKEIVVDGLPVPQKAKQAFKDILNSTKEDNNKKVATSISTCSNTNIASEATCCVKHQFITTMKQTFIKYADWNNINTIELNYAKTSYPASIDFHRNTQIVQDETNDIITLTVHKKEDEHGGYIFYVFGNNKTDEQILNKIQKTIFKNKDTEVFAVEKAIVPGDKLIQGNRHIVLTFNPTSVNTSTEIFSFKRENYNLQEILEWEWSDFQYRDAIWEQSQMIKWVNGLFSGKDTDSAFEPYTLELDIPKIEIDTPWSTENASQTE